MRMRTLIAVFIAFVLTIGASAVWTASTTNPEGDADANMLEDSGLEAGEAPVEKKKGNKVARVLSAPFKAFGRLFSRGDDKRIKAATEEDVAKFESVAVSRVEDSRTASTKKLDASASAKEHLDNGRVNLLNGRLNEAISELSLAASLDPKLAAAHSLLGVAYEKKGLVDRAKDSYERAVDEEPKDAQALNNLGFSLYQNGNYRAAVDRLKRAAKLAPEDDRILNNLGLALCRLGKFQDAFKHFARASGPLMGNLNTARMLERFGREDDAIRYYEDARKIDPSSTVALKRLVDLYQRTGRPEQAQAVAENLNRATVANAATVGR